MKYEIYQDQNSEWFWCLKASSGKKIAICSESYVSQDECLYVVSLVQSSQSSSIECKIKSVGVLSESNR